MSPSQWGPPVWTLFHLFAEKVKDNNFNLIKNELMQIIIQICKHLPCPECAQHATQFWLKVNIYTINTKEDLKKVLFTFHNVVNKRKHKPYYNYDHLDKYKELQLTPCYIKFNKTFNTHGNMNLITDSFHRQRLLIQIKKWMFQNITSFNL